MKARGGIKAIGSINAKTFAVVQRVPLSQLEAFVPQPNVLWSRNPTWFQPI